MSYQLVCVDGTALSYTTAADALSAWTPDVVSIWCVNPMTIDGDQEITHEDLEGLAQAENEL